MASESGERVRWLHAMQRCARCGGKDAFTLNGRWLCADCNEKNNKEQNERRAKDGGKSAAYAKAKRDKHRELGLCIQCSRPAVHGRSFCAVCAARDRKRKSRHPDGYLPLNEQGKCRWCKTEITSGWYCDACKQRMSEIRKNLWASGKMSNASHIWRAENDAIFDVGL